MGRECAVCASPHRAQCELSLANRIGVRVIGKRFGLAKDALYRHRKNHMPQQLVAQLVMTGRPTAVDLDRLRISESEGLLQHLVAQRGRLYRLADNAEDLGDAVGAVRVHSALTRNLELTGKLLGDLRTGSTTLTQNILIAPEYHAMRVALVQALKPFPEARQAVAVVLQGIEARGQTLQHAEVSHEPER